MDTVSKLQDISLRLDQLDQSGEWLSECLAEIDPAAAQAGAMISALSDDLRSRVLDLVADLETRAALICAQLEADTEVYH